MQSAQVLRQERDSCDVICQMAVLSLLNLDLTRSMQDLPSSIRRNSQHADAADVDLPVLSSLLYRLTGNWVVLSGFLEKPLG